VVLYKTNPILHFVQIGSFTQEAQFYTWHLGPNIVVNNEKFVSSDDINLWLESVDMLLDVVVDDDENVLLSAVMKQSVTVIS